ncbi:MAG: zinc-ribbon domain-containing protein [Candidatus Obscuribacterales bacterium]
MGLCPVNPDHVDLRSEDVLPGSQKMIWWTCPQGPDHHWQGWVSRFSKGLDLMQQT